jgi:CelD/BcsL family acetyltransferase involved in cellulose biosynthesis
MLIVSEYSTRADFEELRSDWNDLLRKADSASVFATWEWVEAFWEHGAPGRRPMVIAARDIQGRLVGLLPLARVTRLGVVRILEAAGCTRSGYPIGDYGGLISARGTERAVWKSMLEYLKRSRWNIIDLHNYPGNVDSSCEQMADIFKETANTFGWGVRVQTSDVCRLIRLPDRFDAYLTTLSSNARQNLRRKMRKLTEAGCTIEEVDMKDMVAASEAMETLILLHQQRWEMDHSAGGFSDEQARALHKYLMRSLAACEYVDMRVARSSGGTILGAIYNFRRNGVAYFYSLGISQDPEWSNLSLGVCLLADSIRAAIEEGCHTFDLLRGDHDYKAHFGGYTTDNFRVTIYRSGWLLKVADVLRGLRQMVRRSTSMQLLPNHRS